MIRRQQRTPLDSSYKLYIEMRVPSCNLYRMRVFWETNRLLIDGYLREDPPAFTTIVLPPTQLDIFFFSSDGYHLISLFLLFTL